MYKKANVNKCDDHIEENVNGDITCKHTVLSFNAYFSFFLLANSPTCDLQITACKKFSVHV